MFRLLMSGAAAGAVLLSAGAFAQASQAPDAQATLYNKGHYRGARRTVVGPTQFGEAFQVRSVNISAGTQWELCSGTKYSGCKQITQSTPSMIMNVRSARPVATILTSASGPPTSQSLRGGGGSLRGIASEYFVAPDNGGNRIEVQPGTAETMSRRAIEFCQARGWRTSAHERLQSVAGKFYLADVLCADTGG
jgi:hypothetical protein